MADFNLDNLKKEAAAYLEMMPKGEEISALIGGFPVRDLVILAMAGFACEKILEQLREMAE